MAKEGAAVRRGIYSTRTPAQVFSARLRNEVSVLTAAALPWNADYIARARGTFFLSPLARSRASSCCILQFVCFFLPRAGFANKERAPLRRRWEIYFERTGGRGEKSVGKVFWLWRSGGNLISVGGTFYRGGFEDELEDGSEHELCEVRCGQQVQLDYRNEDARTFRLLDICCKVVFKRLCLKDICYFLLQSYGMA